MSEKDDNEKDLANDTEKQSGDDKEEEELDFADAKEHHFDEDDVNKPEVKSESNHVATIDHETVHIDLTYKTKEVEAHESNGGNALPVVTSQPTVVYGYDQTITIDDTDAPVIHQTPKPKRPKPKDFVVTSCFVTLCCNFIFGLIGYHFGVKANLAWQLGDEPSARSRAKLAMIMVICGIVAGLTTYALAFGLYFSSRDANDPYVEVHNNALG